MGSSSHGNDGPGPISEFRRLIDDTMADERNRFAARGNADPLTPYVEMGKQHDFPAGKYGPEDEGALSLAVGHDRSNQRVMVDFRTPVTWLAMEPAQARHLARMLITHADACLLHLASAEPVVVGIGPDGAKLEE